MKRIDFAEAQAALKAAIAAKGKDYVYTPVNTDGLTNRVIDVPKCSNFTLGEDGARVPSCIVGHAYATWGVLDKVGAIQAVRGSVDELRYEVGFTAKAVDYLDQVQSAQDEGIPWGMAEKIGREYVEGPMAKTSYHDDESKVW